MQRLGAALALCSAACVAPRTGEVWIGEFRGEDPGLGRQRARLVLELEAGRPPAGGTRTRALGDVSGHPFAWLAAWLDRGGGSLLDLAAQQPWRPGADLGLTLETPAEDVQLEGRVAPGGDAYAGTWHSDGLSGSFDWRAAPGAPEVLADYPAILEACLAALEARYVFPARLANPRWRRAVDDARARAGRVRDDVEFVALTHLLFADLGPGVLCLRAAEKPGATAWTLTREGEVAVLDLAYVHAGLEAIDRAFDQARDAAALVIDLRGTVGYDLTAGRLLAHLSTASEPVGYMLGRSRAEDGVLTAAQRDALPLVSGVYSFGLYRATLGLAGVVAARSESFEAERRFGGPVCLLVDRHTRAAVEPVVEFLQRQGRVLVVGEATAGSALDADLVALEGAAEGWVAVVPVGTWVTWSGRWMEGDPVRPDVEVPPERALEAALALIAAGFSPKNPPPRSWWGATE